MSIIRELKDEYDDDLIPLAEALEEALGEAVAVAGSRRGSFVKSAVKGAAGFFKKHPGVTVAAATLALDRYTKYKANQRNTIKLFAKDSYERKMMTSVVDAITKGGKFRVVKSKYADGGKYWVLKRK